MKYNIFITIDWLHNRKPEKSSQGILVDWHIVVYSCICMYVCTCVPSSNCTCMCLVMNMGACYVGPRDPYPPYILCDTILPCMLLPSVHDEMKAMNDE